MLYILSEGVKRGDQKSGGKDKATVIPDTSLDKTVESRKTGLDESNKPEVRKNLKPRITVQQKDEVTHSIS